MGVIKPSSNIKTVEVGKKSSEYGDVRAAEPPQSLGRGSSVRPDESTGQLNERQKLLLQGYRISRIVRVLTMGEIIFIVIFGVLSPAFFCALPFPIFGYIGAKRWNFCLLNVFCIYTFLECLLGITSLFFYYNNVVYIIIRCFDIVFNCVSFYYAKQLAAFSNNLEEEDIYFLQHHPVIKSIEQSLY